MNRLEHFFKRIWYKHFKQASKSEQPSMKDIINENFKKIHDEIEKQRITTDILIEDSKRRTKEINIITKALQEINDDITELKPDKHRNRHAH